jgi:hypothetical protein
MIVLLLLLILLAILYSTEAGREFLAEVIALPFKIIAYPFKVSNENKQKKMLEQLETKRVNDVSNFLKTLNSNEQELIKDDFILPVYFNNIREQISLYKQFEKGEIHKSYLKEEFLTSADGNNKLYVIKPEKINALRKKINL